MVSSWKDIQLWHLPTLWFFSITNLNQGYGSFCPCPSMMEQAPIKNGPSDLQEFSKSELVTLVSGRTVILNIPFSKTVCYIEKKRQQWHEFWWRRWSTIGLDWLLLPHVFFLFILDLQHGYVFSDMSISLCTCFCSQITAPIPSFLELPFCLCFLVS